jgi:hypothetical protein
MGQKLKEHLCAHMRVHSKKHTNKQRTKKHNTSTSTQNKYKPIHSQTCGCDGLVAVKTPPAKNSEWVTCDDDDGVVMSWIMTLKILSIDDVDVVDDDYTDDDDGDDNESDNDNKKSKSNNKKNHDQQREQQKTRDKTRERTRSISRIIAKTRTITTTRKNKINDKSTTRLQKQQKRHRWKYTTTPLAYAPVPDSGWHDASTTALT